MSIQTDVRTGRFILAVDFDGVISTGSWNTGLGEPVDGVKEALHHFHQLGVEIIIHTARVGTFVYRDPKGYSVTRHCQRNEVNAWLVKHQIPFTEIWSCPGKPIADVYLDDKAIRFDEWRAVFPTLLRHIDAKGRIWP